LKGELVVASDADDLAHRVAEHFIACATEAIDTCGSFAVALAGGSTPKAAYARLASDAMRDRIAWARVRFYFGDERCVPPDDEQSNFRMASRCLLEPLAIEADHVARMRGEDEPAVAAAAYAALLRERLGTLPRFDLVMLGMGPDGHTASLFPGEDPLTDDRALVRAPFVATAGTHRITLTPQVINAARTVAIATGGTEKAQALARALEGEYEPRAVPVQIVDPLDGRLVWLVDREAVTLLMQNR